MLVAVCVCHRVEAHKEITTEPPFWVCDVDDNQCEVEFKEVEDELSSNI